MPEGLANVPYAFQELQATKKELRQDLSLITLLNRFKERQYQITHDQVYSLLALCRERSDIKVAYAISTAEILMQTLLVCEQSLCFCTISMLRYLLQLRLPLDDTKEVVAKHLLAEVTMQRSEWPVWDRDESATAFVTDLRKICQRSEGQLELSMNYVSRYPELTFRAVPLRYNFTLI